MANVNARHGGYQSLGGLVILRVRVGGRNVDGSIVQVRMARGKRVVGGHGESEAECILAVKVEPEQPLLSDKTERFVQG